MVGREDELQRLRRVLDRLVEAGPRLVEVTGEAGIGKTRLLDELCADADSREYLVLRGQSAEFERGVPFATVVDALGAYVTSLDPEIFGPPDAELRRELAAIFPGLVGTEPAAALQDERHRAWRAVRELLERLAEERPLVIALDDVQWGDDASVELIAALLAKPPVTRGLLAIAYRAGQAAAPLETALGSVERRRGVHRLRLRPLDERESDELLRERVDPALRRSIFETGGGNPFFMEQLARAAGEGARAGAGPAPSDELGLPAAVAAALSEEIAALPEATRRLVEAAAVAGERFEPDLMAEVAEVGEDAALAAIDELLARELIRQTEVPRRFAFRHPLVWRAVYEGAPGGWRLAAHRRAAHALAARGAPAAERAHHVEHAARRGDVDAVRVLTEAGIAVARTPSAAARWFSAALRLLPESAEHAGERVDLLTRLASARRGNGDLEGCRAALTDALEHVPEDDLARRVWLEATCAAVEGWLGLPEEAHRRLVRTREELPDDHGPEAVLIDTRLALDALYQLDFGWTRRYGRRALESARLLGDPLLLAEAAAALSVGEAVAAQLDDARELHAEAREALQGVDDVELADRLEIFYYLAWAENFMEGPELALETAERGLALSRTSGQGHLLVPLMLARVFPLEVLGRLEEAVAVAEEALQAARNSPNPQYLFWALWECGYAHLLAGGLERALALSEESARAAEGLARNFLSWPQPGSVYGAALIAAGELERGFATGLEGIGGPDAPLLSPFERPLAWQGLVEALLELGRPEEAEPYVERAERLAEQLDLHLPRALAAQARAQFLLHQGDAPRALEAAAAGRELAERRGLRFDAAKLRWLEGQALEALGKRDEAVRVLRAAEAELDACPSVRARDEVRRQLRRLGARVEKRKAPRSSGDEQGIESLSVREREIAELVTDRKTNREIADELFLSQKTVETHLRNVFFKLGVTSRVEVARAVERTRVPGR